MLNRFLYFLFFLFFGPLGLEAQTVCPAPDSLYYTHLTYRSVLAGWRADPGVLSWEIVLVPFGGTDSVKVTSIVPRVTFGPDKINYGSLYVCMVRSICASGRSQWSFRMIFEVPPNCQAWPSLQCGDARTLPFPAGRGYSEPFYLYNCKNNFNPDGTENILNFKVNQSGENRYIVFESANFVQNFRVFGRRVDTSALNNCLDAPNQAWKCFSDSFIGQTVVLRHLEAGDYQLWVKKDRSNQPDTLNVKYLCTISCETPRQTWTKMDQQQVYLNWGSATGPWKFEIALREAGSPTAQTRIVANQAEALWYFPPLASNTLYEWRVRQVCGADSSDWSVWNRFKTNQNATQTSISCPATTFSSAETRPYTFWNNCTKATGYGYKQTLRLYLEKSREYRFIVKNKQNRPFKISYGCCSNPESCVADSAITLNVPAYTFFDFHVIQEDTLPADYTIRMICPCPPQLVAPSAFFRSDSIGYLNWLVPIGFQIDSVDVELQPRNVPFTNIPNARTKDSFGWDTLDYQKDYYCRLRPVCEPPAAWGDTIDFFPILDCNRARKLTCGQPLLLFLGKGYGLDKHQLAGVECWGRERHATFTASATGFYEFKILRRSGNAHALMALITGCSNNIGNYVATGDENVPLRVFLTNGHPYTLILDKADPDTRGEFEVTVACTSNTFDRPYDAQGQLTAEELPILTSCATYSNVGATTDATDPLPTAPNGNWKDGPNHTVWFWLEAPYNGTIHISVKGTGRIR